MSLSNLVLGMSLFLGLTCCTLQLELMAPCHLIFLSSVAFTHWLKIGVLNIKMLYKDGVFMSFDQVRQDFALPLVRHFLQNQFNQFPALPPASSFDSVLEIQPEVKRIVSKLYTSILDMEGFSLTIIKVKWKNNKYYR